MANMYKRWEKGKVINCYFNYIKQDLVDIAFPRIHSDISST